MSELVTDAEIVAARAAVSGVAYGLRDRSQAEVVDVITRMWVELRGRRAIASAAQTRKGD